MRSVYAYFIRTVCGDNSDFSVLYLYRVYSAVFRFYFECIIIFGFKLYCFYQLSVAVNAGNAASDFFAFNKKQSE